MSYNTESIGFCLRCALIAGSLLALGAGSEPTPADVSQARVELCQAASHHPSDSDELLRGAFAMLSDNLEAARAQNALGRALFDYMNGQWGDCGDRKVTERLRQVLHDPHENGPQSS